MKKAMWYEKLKDAGFPYINNQDEDGYATCGHCGDGGPQGLPPTLSELIEACGDRFVCLRKNASGTFAAFGGNEKYPEGSCEQHGPTPEEAVANLWLALNKK